MAAALSPPPPPPLSSPPGPSIPSSSLLHQVVRLIEQAGARGGGEEGGRSLGWLAQSVTIALKREEEDTREGLEIAIAALVQDILTFPGERIAGLFLLLAGHEGAPPCTHPHLHLLLKYAEPDARGKRRLSSTLAISRACSRLLDASTPEAVVIAEEVKGATADQLLRQASLEGMGAVGGVSPERDEQKRRRRRDLLTGKTTPSSSSSFRSTRISSSYQNTSAQMAVVAMLHWGGGDGERIMRGGERGGTVPLLPVQDEEIEWPLLLPRRKKNRRKSKLPLTTATASTSDDAPIRARMEVALTTPLVPTDQQELLRLIGEKEMCGLNRYGLTPDRLPALIEHNPTLAYELLLRLSTSASMEDYYVALVTADLSLHSIEVVNRLTAALNPFPPAFLSLFVTHCIASCGEILDRDMQSRLVGLVCMFVKNLIKTRVIEMEDFFIELQAFCIEFSRNREAAALFRLLKRKVNL